MARRTLAMNLYITTYVVADCLLVYFGLAAAGIAPRPNPQATAGPSRAVLLVLVGTVGALGICGLLAAALWSSAPRRPWFWPVAAVPPVLWFAPDTPQLVGFLADPRSGWRFGLAIISSASLLTLVIAAVVSAVQARAQ